MRIDHSIASSIPRSAWLLSLLAIAPAACGSNPPSSAARSTTQGSPLTQVTSTPNFVQVAAATPQNSVRTVGLPYPKAQSAGDLNVIVVGWNDTTSTITSLADSAGNAYKLAVPLKRSAHLSQAIYYASNIRGEASNSVTVTFDEAAEDVDLRVVEYAGLPGAVVLGSPASATGSDQITSTGGVSVTSTPALVFAAGTTVGSFTGPGGGYTSRIITQPDNDIVEDLVAHDSGIHTVTATQAGPTEWVMQAVAFSGTPVADAGAEHDSSLVHDTGVPDAVTRPSDAGGPPPSASYFVTQSGSGSRTGLSLDNAWSLATFNDTGSLKGGNAVFFSGTLTSPILPSSSGTPAAPLLLDFGTYAAAVESYFGVTSLAYVTIKGGTLSTSAAGGPDGALFDFLGGQSTHITIDGWTYAGPTDGVIDFSDQGDDGKCSYLTLSNNTVDNIAHFAQAAGSDNDGEVLLNNYARTSTNTVEQTDVIDIGAASNWLIQGNKLVNRAPGNQSSPAGNARHNDVIQAYSGGLGHIIRYNWIEQADSVGDGSNSWLMIEELTGSSTGAPSMELYSNVFVGSGTQGNNGAAFDSNIGKFYCYNNTFIRLSTDASNTVRFLAPGIVYIRNNVMQWAINDNATSADDTMTPGAPFDYNFFYNTTAPDTNDQGPHGSLTLDPSFTNFTGEDYSTQSSSPLVGAGDDTIGSAYDQGIAPGATWPNPKLVTRPAGAWDVGAFQSPR